MADDLLSGILGMGNQGLMYQYPQLARPMRQQMFGQALMELGMQTSPVRSPWQAVARAAQGALGGYEMNLGTGSMLDVATQNAALRGRMIRNYPSPYEIPGGPAAAPDTSAPAPAAPQSSLNPPPDQAKLFADADTSHGFLPGTMAALAHWETRGSFDPNARGPQVGDDPNNRAGGVMQIMPKTALDPGYPGVTPIADADRFVAAKAVPFAADYLNARGKQRFGDKWNPQDRTQLAAALTDYSGGYPADQYANPILARIGAGQPIQVASNAADDTGDVGTNYGAQMFRIYREQAAQAAESLDPRLQALAPHLMDLAMQSLNYGRFSTMLSPQGEWVIHDRFGMEKDASPSEQQMDQLTRNWLVGQSRAMVSGQREDPRYAALWQRVNQPQLVDNPAGGKTPVYPPPIPGVVPPGGFGGPPAGGAAGGGGVFPGEAKMPAVDVAAARSEGVPVYQNPAWKSLPIKEAATAANTAVNEGNTWLAGKSADLQKSRDTMQTIERLVQLSYTIPAGDSWSSRITRGVMTQADDKNLAEFRQLSAKLVADSRGNEGINRISEPALDLLEKLAPNERMQPDAMRNALNVYRAREQIGLQHHMFLENYIPRNYGRTGAEAAWDKYLEANPMLQQDKDGNITSKPMVPWQQWFRRNMDPNSGALTVGKISDEPPTTENSVYRDTTTGQKMKIVGGKPVPVP